MQMEHLSLRGREQILTMLWTSYEPNGGCISMSYIRYTYPAFFMSIFTHRPQQIRNDVSSTKIRAFLGEDMSIRYLVPEPVREPSIQLQPLLIPLGHQIH
jgi:hypothetical protein